MSSVHLRVLNPSIAAIDLPAHFVTESLPLAKQVGVNKGDMLPLTLKPHILTYTLLYHKMYIHHINIKIYVIRPTSSVYIHSRAIVMVCSPPKS